MRKPEFLVMTGSDGSCFFCLSNESLLLFSKIEIVRDIYIYIYIEVDWTNFDIVAIVVCFLFSHACVCVCFNGSK